MTSSTFTARDAALDLIYAANDSAKARRRADEAFARWHARARRGARTSASAATRLENLANGATADRVVAESRLWRMLPDVGTEESLLEAAYLLAGIPVPVPA